jgi:hypothetical protein
VQAYHSPTQNDAKARPNDSSMLSPFVSHASALWKKVVVALLVDENRIVTNYTAETFAKKPAASASTATGPAPKSQRWHDPVLQRLAAPICP